jgi:5-hydroxyisourate hydrolase
VNLSVQVVETAFGVPAANLQVVLRRRTNGSGWIDLGEGHTGPDGRLTVWQGTLSASATFQLEFDIDRYYATLGSVPLFPRAIVVVRVGDTDKDLHLPMLISPNLLLTYHAPSEEFS